MKPELRIPNLHPNQCRMLHRWGFAHPVDTENGTIVFLEKHGWFDIPEALAHCRRLTANAKMSRHRKRRKVVETSERVLGEWGKRK